jgi:hypothetical protein
MQARNIGRQLPFADAGTNFQIEEAPIFMKFILLYTE